MVQTGDTVPVPVLSTEAQPFDVYKPRRVLLLEDSAAEAELIEARLRQTGTKVIAERVDSREIARCLRVSAKTVETYRGEIMRWLEIHDVVGLVRYSVRVGLVPQDE